MVKVGLITLILSIPFCVFSQSEDTFTAEEQAELDALDQYLSGIDSASIIGLLDSLIRLENELNRSQIAIKIGYNNESISDKRESLGNESGMYSGLSYYHKSGFFVDATAFLNSQFQPAYYLTNTSVGYLGTLGEHWTYNASYEHYFFNSSAEDEYIVFPYTDGLNASMYFITSYVETGFDYSIIFGDDPTAHRLSFNMIGNIKVKGFSFVDRISFRPTMNVLFGNQVITSIFVDRRFLLPSRRFVLVEENAFGLMNLGFLLPAYFTIGNLNVGVSYQFNLPQELPGEDLPYSNSKVLNLSLSYFIKL